MSGSNGPSLVRLRLLLTEMKGQVTTLTVCCLTAVSLTMSHVCRRNILHVCSHVSILIIIRDFWCQGAGWGVGGRDGH